MSSTDIFPAVIIGLIVATVGRTVVPRASDVSAGFLIVFAIAAAFLGTGAVGTLRDTPGLDWTETVVQIVLSAMAVVVAAYLQPSPGRHARRDRLPHQGFDHT